MSNANHAGTVELNALPAGALNNNNVVPPGSTDRRCEITARDESEARTSQSESDLHEDEDITNYHNTLYRLEAGPDATLPVPRRSHLALEHIEDANAETIPEWPAPPGVAVAPPNNGLRQTKFLISSLALISLAYLVILALAGRKKLLLIHTKAAAVVTLVMSLFMFFMLAWIAVASPCGIAMIRWHGGLLRRGWGWIKRMFRG